MTPESLEELKRKCKEVSCQFPLRGHRVEDGKLVDVTSVNEVLWLITEVERLEFKSQQLSKVSDKLLDIAEYYTKEIDYLRRKLCEDTP
jgi:hypothetical protein